MIILLKLITGEEIIGITESINPVDGFYNIENPMKIEYTMLSGRFGLVLQPFMYASGEKLFTITSKHVIITSIPSEEVKNFYSKTSDQSVSSEISNDVIMSSTFSTLVH